MNENITLSLPTESAPTVARRGLADRFYQAAVMHTLSQMTRGSLRMTLPDGTEHLIGTVGKEPSAVVRVKSHDFFKDCVLFGDIGFAESYIRGDWETDSIERVVAWAIINVEDLPKGGGAGARSLAVNLLQVINRLHHLVRPNSIKTSRRNISEHYDLGNDFYSLWLDPTMTYSSALFKDASQSLEAAQTTKYDRLCQRLHLVPGDHVLEIGCGWGGFSSHAAKNYGCRITAITISQEQFKFAAERMQREGLADRVEIKLIDYRLIEGEFDKIVSIEMMEALGDRYLVPYFQQIDRLLKPRGLVALQYITVPDCRHQKLIRGVDFIQKHIFPGSLLLSIARVNKALASTSDLFMHDLKDIGNSYARTLHLWWQTFNEREAEVRALGFDEQFIRKWNYYLQYCEAAFATRNISVVQAVYTRPNNLTLRKS